MTETIFLLTCLIDLQMAENFMTIFQILSATNVTGSAFGIFLSSLTSDYRTSSIVVMALLITSSYLNGAIWPIEGQFWLLKSFSHYLPTTLPSFALRNVMIRGFDLSHHSVINGILSSIFWTIFLFLISYVKQK